MPTVLNSLGTTGIWSQKRQVLSGPSVFWYGEEKKYKNNLFKNRFTNASCTNMFVPIYLFCCKALFALESSLYRRCDRQV